MTSLQLTGLSKRFGDVVALDDLSLEVHAGEIFGFVGSNGAGKTTTMRIALGVLATDAGTVTWDGRPISPEVRRTIGYMPEERGLYPRMKVGEHLVYLARLSGLPKAAAVAAMTAWTDRLGVATRRDDEILRLSLGNQQRVQLAAALVHDPAVLVLDEPFSGLDPLAVDVMSEVLRGRAAAGVPVLFSSHQLDLVERLCDRVGVVRAGHMEAVGSIAQLQAGATPRWQLVTRSLAPGWAAANPGVSVIDERTGLAGSTLVTVLEERTTSAVPDAVGTGVRSAVAQAMAHGIVEEFAPVKAALSDLFRHLVSEELETPNAPTTITEDPR